MLPLSNIVQPFLRKYLYFCEMKIWNKAIMKLLIININALKF